MKHTKLHEDIINLVKKETEFFKPEETLEIKEVGDGNVNYIFRVSNDDASVIVKFADSFIRNSTTRELSTKRNEIENEILKRQAELSPGSVPIVYHYSSEMSCIIMEDMSDFKVLREAMMKKETFEHFSSKIAQFLYDTLVKTTDIVMDVNEKKELASHLVNLDMCEISERLVFSEPYLNNQGLNKYSDKNETFVQDRVYNNETLKLEVSKLKNQFMNNTESMIHGDLHAGSIFINDTDLKVFDPEFSFYGPMGYDIGNVIGSYIITYVVSQFEDDKTAEDFNSWVKNSITEVLDQFIAIYKVNILNDAKTPMLTTGAFTNYFLTKILSDTAGYAGTEIIRRTIGVAKVWDLERVQDHAKIDEIERALLGIGTDLIIHRNSVESSKEITDILNKHMKEARL